MGARAHPRSAYTHVCACTRNTYASPEKQARRQKEELCTRSAPGRKRLFPGNASKEPGGQLFLQRPPPQPSARSDWSTIDTFSSATLLCLARCHSERGGGVSEGAFPLDEECCGRSERRFFFFFKSPQEGTPDWPGKTSPSTVGGAPSVAMIAVGQSQALRAPRIGGSRVKSPCCHWRSLV